jgi:hypothetical protein
MSRKNCVKKLVFCWHLEGQRRKFQDPDPDPLVRGMDLRIRIHPKMSWIRNSEKIVLYCILISTYYKILSKNMGKITST